MNNQRTLCLTSSLRAEQADQAVQAEQGASQVL